MRTPAWCRSQAAGIGPACEQVIAELLADNALYRLRAAQGMIGLADRHDPSRLEAACAKAIAAGDPSYRTIKGILAAGTERDAAPRRGRGRRRRGVPARPRLVRQRHPPARHAHQRRRASGQHPGGQLMTTVTVTDRSALAAALRNLKLSGMLDTLDARLAQAHAGELGHLDFLQVLCQDEISRRETMSLARRLRRARFEDRSHPRRLRLRRLPEAARRPDPRPGRAALAARRRVRHPLRPGRRRQEPHRPGPRPTWPSAPAPTPGSSKPAGSWPTWPAATPTAPGTSGSRELTRPAVLVLDDFAMRELTAAQADDLYELITERAGKSTHPDQQPGARRLVPAVPQPRRRRIPPGPAHQHQPPGLHERPKLPPQQTPRARHPHRDHERQLK